jgi:thiol-disulfide isomerase/thioredoxin
VRRLVAALAVLLAAVLVTGCAPDDLPTLDRREIDVNTPELVQAKQDAGIEDCVPGTGGHVDGGLPAVTLPCLGGGPDVDLSTLRGPMLVSLWAYWCQQCRDEMPILQRFHQRYGDQVPLLGVDYLDPQVGGAMALMSETEATYPSVADPYGDLSAQRPLPVIRGLPYLLFVGADGVVTHIEPGAVKSQKELVDLVEQHLGTTP